MNPSNSGSSLKIYFKILNNESSQEVHKTYIDVFKKKKNHLKQMDHFGSGNATFFSKLFAFNFAKLKGLRGK